MTSGGGDTIGEPAPGRARVVAAFDFDGTLSTRDNFVPFLAEFAGGSTFVREMASAVLQVAGAGRAGWSRDELKAAALAHIMTGRRVDDFEATARRFGRAILRDHLRAEAVEQAAWHRDHGHRLVIVSASLAAYLRPVADALGFDAVLATELEAGTDGRLTGAIVGHNVRGAEKVRRLDAYLAEAGDGEAYVFAYGDSSGDRQLWARADRAVRMGRRAHLGAR
jgi:HAD superfamily hydrolase (TIGR01490 family)